MSCRRASHEWQRLLSKNTSPRTTRSTHMLTAKRHCQREENLSAEAEDDPQIKTSFKKNEPGTQRHKRSSPCRRHASSSGSHDVHETSDSHTSNCLSSHLRRACAASTFDTSSRRSLNSDLLSWAKINSFFSEKKRCSSSFLQGSLPRPATLCPAYFTPVHFDTSFTLFVHLSLSPLRSL